MHLKESKGKRGWWRKTAIVTIVVIAPIPIASDAAAVRAKIGLRRSSRIE